MAMLLIAIPSSAGEGTSLKMEPVIAGPVREFEPLDFSRIPIVEDGVVKGFRPVLPDEIIEMKRMRPKRDMAGHLIRDDQGRPVLVEKTYRGRASEIIAQLKSWEQFLNSIGRSLNDPVEPLRETQPLIMRLAGTDQRTQMLAAQREELGIRLLCTPSQITKASELKARVQSNVSSGRLLDNMRNPGPGSMEAPALANLGKTNLPGATDYEHELADWSVSYGERDVFQAYAGIEARAWGSSGRQVGVEGSAEAYIYLFDSKKTIFELSTYAKAKKEDFTSEMSFIVLGDVYIDDDADYDGSFRTVTEDERVSVSVHKSVNFMVGPVPIEVEVGATGTATLTLENTASAYSVDAHVIPELKVDAYATAGVDILIAEAGVGCNLTVADLELDFYGNCRISDQNTETAKYWSEWGGDADLTLLDGYLYLYATVWNPFGRDPYYDVSILNWNGYSLHNTIFYDDKNQNVY